MTSTVCNYCGSLSIVIYKGHRGQQCLQLHDVTGRPSYIYGPFKTVTSTSNIQYFGFLFSFPFADNRLVVVPSYLWADRYLTT